MTQPKKKKGGFRIKTEVLVILVFFLSFIMWAISKCNAKKAEYVVPETEQTEEAQQDSIAESATAAQEPARPQSEAAQAAAEAPQTVTEIKTVYATKLYVTIDSLKMRSGPSLNSSVIKKLPLFDEVIFLNEVSDSTEIISLGENITANEPWVKVRHWKGQEGWVYGAGVHYYKFQYPGVE